MKISLFRTKVDRTKLPEPKIPSGIDPRAQTELESLYFQKDQVHKRHLEIERLHRKLQRAKVLPKIFGLQARATTRLEKQIADLEQQAKTTCHQMEQQINSARTHHKDTAVQNSLLELFNIIQEWKLNSFIPFGYQRYSLVDVPFRCALT